MNDDWTIEKLFDEICRVEVEHKLFEEQIDGVYIWKLIRFYLFTELSQKLNLRDNPHPDQEQTTNRYTWLLKHFINGTFNGPLTGKSNAEILLFSHPRKVITDDDKLIDIYSDYLEEMWTKEGTNYLVIEKPYNGTFLRKASRTVRHNETLSIFTLWNYLKPKKNMNISINGLDAIAGIPIESIEALSEENISRAIHTFKRAYHYYTKVLTKHKPKKIYMVVAYFRHALVAAADDLDIETIEIQHGEISPFNIGYNYPGHKKIPYFPSKLILWGEFWYNPARIPVDEKNISYDGFPFLDMEIKKYANVVQDKTRVLFISQGTNGKLLVDIAIEFASQNKEYTVIYRLHPSEAEGWEALYPKLYAHTMKNTNIIVETSKSNPLYKSFAESKFVVGVNSTALIESLTLKCKLVLINLPGVEYFQSLVDQKLVKKVNNAEALALEFKADNKQITIDRNYFFKEYKIMRESSLINQDWTIKKLFEELCRIEIEYKLFEKQIDGIYVWKLIRFYIFTELSQKLNLREKSLPDQEPTTNRYTWLLKHFINGTFNGPLTGKSDAEILLFSHPRKVITEDDTLIDIYSEYLENKWNEEGTNYLVLEKPHNGVFMRKASKVVRHNETLSLFTLWNYLKPKKDMDFTFKGLDAIADIPISHITTLSKENISRTIHTFKREYHYYTKVLTKHKPKKVYMVVAYFRHALVAAADNLGIETIEIQHGEISPFNIGYNYPGHKKIPYFPSSLILWGEFWYNSLRMPIDVKNISYDGFPYLDEEIKKYVNEIRDESRVLFISQAKIGRLLVAIALEFAERNKAYKVVYRLHPTEANEWEALYPNLYSASMENDNIMVETGKINPLHKSFAESKFVVGVNSTALIESLTLHCKLVLVDLPGVEYFQSLIDKKLVKKVGNAEKLANELKEDNQQMTIDRNYFFKEYKAE